MRAFSAFRQRFSLFLQGGWNEMRSLIKFIVRFHSLATFSMHINTQNVAQLLSIQIQSHPNQENIKMKGKIHNLCVWE